MINPKNQIRNREEEEEENDFGDTHVTFIMLFKFIYVQLILLADHVYLANKI